MTWQGSSSSCFFPPLLASCHACMEPPSQDASMHDVTSSEERKLFDSLNEILTRCSPAAEFRLRVAIRTVYHFLRDKPQVSLTLCFFSVYFFLRFPSSCKFPLTSLSQLPLGKQYTMIIQLSCNLPWILSILAASWQCWRTTAVSSITSYQHLGNAIYIFKSKHFMTRWRYLSTGIRIVHSAANS